MSLYFLRSCLYFSLCSLYLSQNITLFHLLPQHYSDIIIFLYLLLHNFFIFFDRWWHLVNSLDKSWFYAFLLTWMDLFYINLWLLQRWLWILLSLFFFFFFTVFDFSWDLAGFNKFFSSILSRRIFEFETHLRRKQHQRVPFTHTRICVSEAFMTSQWKHFASRDLK